jgi:hypothetical protein
MLIVQLGARDSGILAWWHTVELELQRQLSCYALLLSTLCIYWRQLSFVEVYPSNEILALWSLLMANTRGERLRAARRKLFRSARAAALAMRIPVSTYGAHERAQLPGGRDYGPDAATRYARRFGVTPEWLLTGLRQAQTDIPFPPEQFEEPRTPKLPVLGYVGAGAEAYYYDVSQGFLDDIDLPKPPTDATVILEIHDDSVGSLFNRWLVFFDEVRKPVTPDLLGRLCVVGLDDGRMFVKQLQHGQCEGKYDLISESGATLLDVSVRWAAKVTAILPART